MPFKSMKPLTKNLKAGMHLFHENDRSRELYVIQQGKIRIYRKSGNREIELSVLSKGSVLGEMALIDGKPRSASAIALEESIVILIDTESFHAKIKGVPAWYISMIKMTSQKIRNANNRLQAINSENRNMSIILTLYYLASYQTSKNHEIFHIKNQIIQLLGASHQKTASILEHLHKSGFITLQDNTFSIIDRDCYLEYCTFLRCSLRKQLKRYCDVSPELTRLCRAVTETVPELRNVEGKEVEIDGEKLWSLFVQCRLENKYPSIISDLIMLSMLSFRKKGSFQDGNPLTGSLLKLTNPGWAHLYLTDKYWRKIPTL